MKIRYVHIKKVLEDTMTAFKDIKSDEQLISGISSGLHDFDSFTSGFHDGELFIIASRPSVGKSAFAINLALNVGVRQKKKIAFFTLQMSNINLLIRMLGVEAKIDIVKLRRGYAKQKALNNLGDAENRISKSNIFLIDSNSITISKLLKTAGKINTKHIIEMIIIDYFQLIRLKENEYILSSEDEIKILASLKKLALSINVPVILLYKLPKPIKKQYKPSLNDLRTPEAIERIADVVIFMYRDELYNDKTKKMKIAELIFQKNRSFTEGYLKIWFDKGNGRFKDL